MRFLGAVLLLSSCASANAVEYDATNDMHCYALSTYFAAVEHKRAAAGETPTETGLQILLINQWFRASFDREAARIGKAAAQARAEPLYKAIGSDFEQSKRAFNACVERAASDPGYVDFAQDTLRAAKRAR